MVLCRCICYDLMIMVLIKCKRRRNRQIQSYSFGEAHDWLHVRNRLFNPIISLHHFVNLNILHTLHWTWCLFYLSINKVWFYIIYCMYNRISTPLWSSYWLKRRNQSSNWISNIRDYFLLFLERKKHFFGNERTTKSWLFPIFQWDFFSRNFLSFFFKLIHSYWVHFYLFVFTVYSQ